MTIKNLIDKYIPEETMKVKVDFYADILELLAKMSNGSVVIDRKLIEKDLLQNGNQKHNR